MENNTNNNQPFNLTPNETAAPPPTPVVPTPAEPPVIPPVQNPVVEPVSVPPPDAPKSNKTLLFVILAIVLVAVLGTVYVIFIMGKSSAPTPAEQPAPTAIPTPSVTPTPSPSAEEINSMDVGDPQQDIDALNQDLNQL